MTLSSLDECEFIHLFLYSAFANIDNKNIVRTSDCVRASYSATLLRLKVSHMATRGFTPTTWSAGNYNWDTSGRIHAPGLSTVAWGSIPMVPNPHPHLSSRTLVFERLTRNAVGSVMYDTVRNSCAEKQT